MHVKFSFQDLIFAIVCRYHQRALEQATLVDRLYLQDLGPNHCLVEHNFLRQMFGEWQLHDAFEQQVPAYQATWKH